MVVDTITAIATPPGRGGVGIVRLSGPLAYPLALLITKAASLRPRFAHFCKFYGSDGGIIDEGIVLFFKNPHSFTGEDVVEFQAHGAPFVLDCLIKTLLAQGARLARPGEFSERAFLNERIDLTQAEAIADLISANSESAARLAQRSLQGDFSHKIYVLSEKLVHLRMYVEAAIDFPEEEVDFLSDGRIAKLLQTIIDDLALIRAEASQGALLREGLSVVIAGRPNAGKSTLINALAGREVAIVTDVAGTTRDVMREMILLDDIPLHIIDTAGIRDSSDVVELEGIKRAWHEIKNCDCVLQIIDINENLSKTCLNDEIQAALPNNVPIITVFNKVDTQSHDVGMDDKGIYVSAKYAFGLDILKTHLKKVVGYQPHEGLYLARRRHLQALDEAIAILLEGQNQLVQMRAGELLAEDLRLSHDVLCSITGRFTTDDLLGEIFSSFCIGK